MKRRKAMTRAAALLWLMGSAFALAAAVSPAAQAGQAVDAMALYGQGAAVVEDSRRLDLKQGNQTLNWPIAGSLQADTLWLAGSDVKLTGFQLIPAPSRAGGPLAARINEPVTLIPDNGGKPIDGLLAAVDGDIAYVRVGGAIRRITPASPVQISWNGGVATKPPASGDRLRLDIDAAKAGAQQVTATYQIAAPSWQASYTGQFDPKAGALKLQSTAVIDNSGGQTALNADQAWLVAGEVSRSGGNQPRPLLMAHAKASDAAAGPPKASGDTYRYALKNGLRVPAGAVRAIALMAPATFQAERSYRFENSAFTDRGNDRMHADVDLSFANGSGTPLPAGTLRVYNAAGTADLMGEASIDDTPTGAPVDLTLGQSFDLTATHQVVSQAKPAEDTLSRTIEITVYNAGARAAPVTLVEDLPRGAAIVSASRKRQSKDGADNATWQFGVPAGGQKKLRYTFHWSRPS